jgi:hypothetical protein
MARPKPISDPGPRPLQDRTDIIPLKERVSSKLFGPIAVAGQLHRDGRLFDLRASYTSSEIVVFDWLSRFDTWKRAKLVIPNALFALPFSPESVADIQVMAWPCSLANYNTEDGGWAIDEWNAHAEPDDDIPVHCRVVAEIAVSLRGVCARLNRIGYSWTLYLGVPRAL